MNNIQIENLLEKLKIEHYIWLNEKQVQVSCPLAPWLHKNGLDKRPSCGISIKGKPKFNCFTCGESGGLWSLVDTYISLSRDFSLENLRDELLAKDDVSLSTKFESIVDNTDWLYKKEKVIPLKHCLRNYSELEKRCRAYLIKRRVTEKTAKEFDLRYDRKSDRLIFPVKDQNNNIVGAVGRTLRNEYPKYKNLFGFKSGSILGGLNKVNDRNNNILVVEGFFDLLVCYRFAQEIGLDVVCSWTAHLTKSHIDQLSSLNKIVFIGFDGDAAGEKGWQGIKKLRRFFIDIRRAKIPKEQDIGDLHRQQFFDIIAQLRKANLTSFAFL